MDETASSFSGRPMKRFKLDEYDEFVIRPVPYDTLHE